MGAIYFCDVDNNPNIITQESAQIDSITGQHFFSKSNDNVNAFHAVGKTLKYFPQGLDLYFKRLQAILMWSCQLKCLRQSDLKPFTELFFFYLMSNGIRVLEAGLFDFNTKLEYLNLHENDIVHIDPNVFDNLSKLRYFFLKPVGCIHMDVDDDSEKVQLAIQEVKRKCKNLKYLELKNDIKNLEVESKTLDLEDFEVKLDRFRIKLRISIFSNFEDFKVKFEEFNTFINEARNNQN